MRIIGGAFGGRRIVAPKGRVARPTADRTREALFNLLSAREDVVFQGARILDLFAGSGALGFEAMSRGGAFCLFVETDTSARGAIRDNIEALDLFGATRIHRRSALGLGPRPKSAGAPFDIAFLDPPYGKGFAQKTLQELGRSDWLAGSAILIIEQGADEDPALTEDFARLDHRTYGAAQISVLQARVARC